MRFEPQPHDQAETGFWALVPVKALPQSKQRLRPCLGPDRAGLTVAMLCDVLQALSSCRTVGQIAIVTADAEVSAIAKARSALVVDEIEAKGMNEALDMGIEAIRRAGGCNILIVPADIPLLTAPEVDRLLNEFQARRRSSGEPLVGIGPSRDRGGTNFLCLDARRPFPLMYGPESYRRHRECAVEQGCRPVLLESSCVSLDIDEEKDLKEFISFCLANSEFQKSQTWGYLQELAYINHSGRAGITDVNEQSNSLPN